MSRSAAHEPEPDWGASPLAAREIDRQRLSNQNALRHGEAFANHRRHLTKLAEPTHAKEGGRPSSVATGDGRLCVLGAGNALDLDLERLTALYRSVHLVDIDEQALERARERQSESTRARLVTHGPIDLSGVLSLSERWHDMQVSLPEIASHPEHTSARIAAELGGPFSVVVSACVLSQMQLAVRNILSEHHRLFDVASYTLTLTHLRLLARLTEPGGRAVLASDVATEVMAGLHALDADANLRQLLMRLVRSGDVFNIVSPDVVMRIASDDPNLLSDLSPARLADVWLWQNGPQRMFLVYALEIERLKPAASTIELWVQQGASNR